MKQNLKNRAHGIASIMKNYSTHERTTMTGTLYLGNVVKFHQFCRLQPVNGLPIQSLSSYISSIHVEPPEETGEDRTILYDIPSCNVIEFRGVPFEVTLSSSDINNLLIDNVDICYEEGTFSAMKLILLGYNSHRLRSNRFQNNNVLGYMKYLLDGTNPDAFRRVIGNYERRQDADTRKQCADDLAILRSLAVDMETPTLKVRYYMINILICLV
jgi:hypothetical protein